MREICGECERPKDYCMCEAFLYVKEDLGIKIWILQHPLERKKTLLKRTAWFTEKMMSNVETLVGRNHLLCKSLVEAIEHETSILLFPSKTSKDVKSLKISFKDIKSCKETKLNLIVLDGTWKQAKKIFINNEPLFCSKNILHCHISESSGIFTVRRPPKEGYVSTYESIVEVLSVLFDLSSEKLKELYKPLELANKQWNDNLPEHCKVPREKKK